MYKFHPSILRAYDIRGIYNKTLFDDDAFFVAKAFVSSLKIKSPKIAIAFDGRISSPSLRDKLVSGLLSSGAKIQNIGLGPTPMLYFAVHHLNCDGGIMITGSHNPKEHNGFKMMLKDRPFYGDDIKNLGTIATLGDFINSIGSTENIDLEGDYIDILINGFTQNHIYNKTNIYNKSNIYNTALKSPSLDEGGRAIGDLKIVWDVGNGASGNVVRELIKKINCDHILLFDEIDGNFPNHHPDPTDVANLVVLRQTVVEKKYDIGIAFDGDADRIGIVDDEGEVLFGDQFMIFFAREVLKNNPGATIIADVKASKSLFDEIKKAGGNPIMWKTGHSLIKAKMKETKSLLAGEMSGHIFFADKYFGYDDAIYAAVRMIDILLKSKIKLSQMRKELPKTFATDEIRIECDEEKKFTIVEDIKENLKKKSANFNDIDGVRCDTDAGWWLVRASNTQAVLVARCEADSEESLENLKEDLRKILSCFGVKIPKNLLNYAKSETKLHEILH
jgi:phosphomannomutase